MSSVATFLLRSSFITTKRLTLSTTRNSYANKQLSSVPISCLLQKEMELTVHHVRKYCARQNVPNVDAKQVKNRPIVRFLKYLSGFIGACALTGLGLQMYKELKLKQKGFEPVRKRFYGQRRTAYRYRGYNVPRFVADGIDDINSFQVKEDDIWLLGYPKSGTTWLGELIYLINNEANFDSVKTKIDERFPFFEYFHPGIKVIENMPSPRYIKTHLPFSLLPSDFNEKKPKTVYIARNPKDIAVSFHFFMQEFFVKSRWSFALSFDDYCQLFLDDEVHYGPWWKHVIEGWEHRSDDHILYITYEDMKMDLPGSIRKIAKHLGKKLTDQDVEAIAAHCSFEAMKSNKFVNHSWYKDRGIANKDAHFMRKGIIGDWKNHLSKDTQARMDHMLATKLEPVDIRFKDSSNVGSEQ